VRATGRHPQGNGHVIFGTGFHVTDMLMASWIHGREGRTPVDVWIGGAQAHRGTTVAGFPHWFMLVGPIPDSDPPR
jgi:cation diffusion facilitator CzcD-associated flavoprotein CzcO